MRSTGRGVFIITLGDKIGGNRSEKKEEKKKGEKENKTSDLRKTNKIERQKIFCFPDAIPIYVYLF